MPKTILRGAWAPGMGADYERFREKARAYLGEHEDRLPLQRLRRNLPAPWTTTPDPEDEAA